MNGQLNNIFGLVKDFWGLITPERAANLDNLDAAVSSLLSNNGAAWHFEQSLSAIANVLNNLERQVVEVFNTAGNHTFTVPNNALPLIWVSLCGGGGGSVYYSNYRYGGGGAAAILDFPVYVSPGQIIPFSVGAGGTYGNTPTVYGVVNGGAGTMTSFLNLGAAAGGAAVAYTGSTSGTSRGGLGGNAGVYAGMGHYFTGGDGANQAGGYSYLSAVVSGAGRGGVDYTAGSPGAVMIRYFTRGGA